MTTEQFNVNIPNIPDEDGYELWLRYPLIDDDSLLATYRAALKGLFIGGTSATLQVAQDELARGLNGLLGVAIPIVDAVEDATLIIGTPQQSDIIHDFNLDSMLKQVGDEGFAIASREVNGHSCIVITANTDIGVLYGTFRFLRELQTHQSLENLAIIDSPRVQLRMLNHWDNLDGTIERGYAGFSLWDWHKLPDYLEPRYTDYARANACIGINGVTLTNVNSNAVILMPQFLEKMKAMADLFRPYGIRLYMTARFNAPTQIGNGKTADPLDPTVIEWWNKKAAEIYELIPDFGGFVVKANSEGQPGPHDFGRTHVDGANLLANAVAPYGGLVIWRAFVYDDDVPEDRHKQAYTELVPADGQFHENVLLQVKNGAIDFQPREPFHPLFGAMPKTPLMLELQITQEYLGCATHLVYLAPLFRETLDADTYCDGEGSLVANVIDGSQHDYSVTGMAGVTNIGSDRNWCGHPFAPANWYAYGRLAWDHRLSSEQIADEWLRMTFTNNAAFLDPINTMMIVSRETVVKYMTPLGLHHIMARRHHYGPGPWVEGGRSDWTSVYYHQADEHGVGFDRTKTGSNAVSQYFSPLDEIFGNRETCPEELLLWFHHVAWDDVLSSGRTLWDELCYQYQNGVNRVRDMQQTWESVREYVDAARFKHVESLLRIQEKEARWWRDACLLYFQTFSNMPISDECEPPENSLDYYMKLRSYYVPGISEVYAPYAEGRFSDE